MFSRGDRVTVTSNSHPEEGSKSYVGSSGEVTGMTGIHNDIVTVRLDNDTHMGFGTEEVTRNR